MKKNNSKLNSKILIISQLRPKIFKLNNSDILFLNEGCKLYKNSKKYKYELYKNNSVLNYKIKYLEKKFSYLLKIYESLLETLSEKLNKIHNLNYSVQYWRIIIGPWLMEFISILHHNWKVINYLNNNYLIKYVEVAKLEKNDYYFIDYNDFVYSSITDKFNNNIYIDLLKYFKNFKIKYFLIHKKRKLKRIFILFYIRKFVDSILLFCNSFLNNRFFFHESYFTLSLKFLIGIRIFQFPSYYKSPSFEDFFLNKKIRKQKFDYSNDKFLNILNNLIFKYIPVSYIENFDKYRQTAKTIIWPKDPRIIFSSNSFIHDDFFKIWLAEKKESSHSKFISGQHGGNFFITKFHFYELHQRKISEKILTWGYKKENIYKPMFNFKTVFKKIKFNSQGKLLIVDHEISRFPTSTLVYNNFPFLSHFSNKLKFIKNLNHKIRNDIIFRAYVHDFGWNTIDRLKEINKSIKIDRNKNMYDSLNNSRVVFINLNSTVFLELLNLNFPTIIYFDPKDLIRSDAKYYFDILKEVNIYFDDSTSAAKHLNNTWNQVDKWWYNKKTQNAISKFCNRFSRRTYHPVNELVFFFKKNL